jgi:hypothetical protein
MTLKPQDVDLHSVETAKGDWGIHVQSVVESEDKKSVFMTIILERNTDDEHVVTRMLQMSASAPDLANASGRDDLRNLIRNWIETSEGDGSVDGVCASSAQRLSGMEMTEAPMTLFQPNLCPVCGFDLGFQPWAGNSASDEICPCCHVQFGYDDWKEETRADVYKQWREKWISEGMKWQGKGRERPENWNPVRQLADIGIPTLNTRLGNA